MAIRKASRAKAKLRMAISGPTGSGKTYTALLIAYGMTGDWDKICIIDTENRSADLYENLGSYSVRPLDPPYTPERYIEAIKECEDAGFEVIIGDSTSHEWNGQGGVLEQVDIITASSGTSGNKFTSGWKVMSPRHEAFVDKIKFCSAHFIATMRSKQEYVLVEEGNGKKKPVKMGLAPIQREGVEYEFTLHIDMSINNHASVLKDRTQLFDPSIPFKPTVDTGKALIDWCERGVEMAADIKTAIENLAKCDNEEELKMLKATLPEYVKKNPDFVKAATDRYNEVKPKA